MKYSLNGIMMVLVLLLFSGCALFNRNRITEHVGLERSDFGLPLILYPSSEVSSKKIIIILSGDGGWLDFEDELARQFSTSGFHTIGFNTRTYFWKQRTPQQLSADVLKLLRKYRRLYHVNQIYLCGYSFGADVVPFIYNRMPPRPKRAVASVQLLSPFASSDFMVHTADLLNLSGDNKPYKVAPEVMQITAPVFIYYGQDEKSKALENLKQKNITVTIVPGDHHYDFPAYQTIIDSCLKFPTEQKNR